MEELILFFLRIERIFYIILLEVYIYMTIQVKEYLVGGLLISLLSGFLEHLVSQLIINKQRSNLYSFAIVLSRDVAARKFASDEEKYNDAQVNVLEHLIEEIESTNSSYYYNSIARALGVMLIAMAFVTYGYFQIKS